MRTQTHKREEHLAWQIKNIGDLLPKIAGSLHLEFKTCGRSGCRCRSGLPHGPYLYRHWREAGQQHKTYVPMRQLTEVLRELERHRAGRIRPSEVRRVLRELSNV